MKRYSILHVPVMAFFSKSLYRDVCFNWKGTGFGYLLLLLALCWIPDMVKMHQSLSVFLDQEAPKVVDQIPEMTITAGKASIDEPQPYAVTTPDLAQALVVFDMTGQTKSLKDANTMMLITETEAIYKKSEIETRTFSFRDIKEFKLTRAMINGWLAIVKKWAAAAVYPFALAGSYVYRIVQLLLYAAIGLLFAEWCKSQRTYAQLLRLAVVAVTPCIILSTVLALTSLRLPLASLLFFLMTMGYLFFGVKAASAGEGMAPPL